MPVHIDEPAPGMAFDPKAFSIRGWVWLEERHPALTGVVATSGKIVLGEADVSTFYERPDVSAKYHLPPGTRTSFDFSARHPEARLGDPFQLELRAKLKDGTLTAPIFSRTIAPLPPEADPARMLATLQAEHDLGLEIGAHQLPFAGLAPFYTDLVALYAGSAGRVDFISDARALPLANATLDYLCSSHVLEHLADPIAALHEWHRVLRPGGNLYLVVPDRRFTFDEPRAVTPSEHLLQDFAEGATFERNAPHIDEFVFQTDWARLHPEIPAGQRAEQQRRVRDGYRRDLAAGKSIDIHFHTFTPESVDRLLQAAGLVGGKSPKFEVLARAERYPVGREDGIALLLRKTGESPPAQSRPDTFALTRSADYPKAAASLPLVCPVSLRPLDRLTLPDGRAALNVRGSDEHYAFVSGYPVLLPRLGAQPVRPWGARSWPALPSSPPATPSPDALTMLCHLDEPGPGAVIDPLCGFVRGWVWLDARHRSLAAIEAWSDNTLIGETSAPYSRPDVSAAHGLPVDARTGFELFIHHPGAAPGATLDLSVRARLADGSRTDVLTRTTIATIPRDYRQNHFGILLDQRTTAIQREANIFATGPSQAEGSGELAALLRRYLGPAPHGRIIDVGCGLGSYGRGLIADGYDWFGVEIDPADCAELKRLGLPHQQVDGRSLPFADGAFDTALCLEVLEHIEEPHAFLREVSRVAPRQIIVSVPNCELLGYLWDHLATPWHMLESTHVNYFTRWSLGALLREFYPHVELRFHTPYPLQTIERTPLHYNLLAIARSAL